MFEDGIASTTAVGGVLEAGLDTDDAQWLPPVDDLPPPFGECAPSGWLALELDDTTADEARLTDPDLVDALAGFDRLASWALVRQARLLAELGRRRPADDVAHTARTAGVASEYAPDEVGVALHLSRGTAAARLDTACRLLSVLPATFALWEVGRIDTAKARAIHDATLVLPDDLAVAVEARLLPRAPQQTLAQLKAALLAALLSGRLVAGSGSDDAPGSGGGTGSPIHPVTPGKPLIQVVVPHSTLIGADDRPAELVGHGPIPASLARKTAADAVWRRLVTDPVSGTLLDHGRTTYHPPAGLADHVRARDLYCRFPGCRRKAADAELDHVVAWADGGPTSAGNLHALCGHHHRLKTHTDWRVEGHPDGRLTWTTPTGHRHTTAPHDHGDAPRPPPAPVAEPPSATNDPDPPRF